jgi:hypothetical protein
MPALDLRSRPVADAVRRFRSPRDQGPHRPAGHGKPIQACNQSTTCLQSQIGRDRYVRRQGTARVEAAVALSVVVRSGPIGTAVNGMLVARPAR